MTNEEISVLRKCLELWEEIVANNYETKEDAYEALGWVQDKDYDAHACPACEHSIRKAEELGRENLDDFHCDLCVLDWGVPEEEYSPESSSCKCEIKYWKTDDPVADRYETPWRKWCYAEDAAVRLEAASDMVELIKKNLEDS
jgi:hypothetical protein